MLTEIHLPLPPEFWDQRHTLPCLLIYFCFMYMSVLPACMSMYQCVPGTYGSQKRALVPLEMNLQMVVSCWESYLSPLEEQPVLLTTEQAL